MTVLHLAALLSTICAASGVGAAPAPLPREAAAAAEGRVQTSLDAGWRFRREEQAGARAADFDDAAWDVVTLPHTFNGGDGDDGGSYYRGPGWYRRIVTVAAKPAGRRVWIQFDGAALATDVYVNGRAVGRHEGGHARFRFDITDAIAVGTNHIAVRVDNSRQPAIAPLGGDFTVFGGLYRHVSLIEADDVHIDLADHGGPGVYAAATRLDDRSAEVAVRVRLRNDAASARRGVATVVIRDAAGRAVSTATRTLTLRPQATGEQVLTLRIADPHRWNGREDPYLYAVEAAIRADGQGDDIVSVPLGLRTTAIDPQRGFLLNGRPYPLHGVNLFHSGRPGRGLAVTDDEVDADMKTLDELGVTGVRMVHFQHPAEAYDEADRRGFVVWTEIGLNGVVDDSDAFQAGVSEQMRELIRQNYNHPSVALWGIGNEVYAVTPEVTRILTAVQAVAHAEDPSRPTVYAHCCQEDDNPKAKVTDVIGFNRYFGWYPGQAGTIGSWADTYHTAHPDRAFAVSEYGAGASIRHQQLPPPDRNAPESGWHPEQAQTLYHQNNWRDLATRSYLFGAFVWVAFDLASDGRHEGDRSGINDKGLVTYDRATRKDAFYYYQAQWSKTPMIHIADRRLRQRHEARMDVTAFTNRGAATLKVNGRSIGSATADGGIVTWRNVALDPGDNRLEAAAADASATDAVTLTRTAPSRMGLSPIPEAVSTAAPPRPASAPPGQ